MRWIKSSDNPIKKIVLQPITSWLSMGSMITMIPDNQKIYAEWHSYEKIVITLLIVGTGIRACHFW